MKSDRWGLGSILNRVQSTFVGVLRVWSIPIVLMLGIASGYTTFYGMSFFITPWIALIITIAVQSIIVICSLEIASMHWRANRMRYFLTGLSLLISVSVSVSFSYFKFYEISEKETMELQRLTLLKHSIEQYLDEILKAKATMVKAQQERWEHAADEANMAFLGTHPKMNERYRNKVGRGPFWEQYNTVSQLEQKKLEGLNNRFNELAAQIGAFRIELNQLGGRSYVPREAFEALVKGFTRVQSGFENIATDAGYAFPPAPMIQPYAEFNRGFKPSFAMWEAFSWFAFACAAMVDLFTIILSYRLEYTAPGPLSNDEEDLAFQCLREFRELRINSNDELEMRIEKSELERARRYSDWNRSFGAAYLLNRGYLRKVDDKTVEFAPNLYPIIAERLGTRPRAAAPPAPVADSREDLQKRVSDTVKRLYNER